MIAIEFPPTPMQMTVSTFDILRVYQDSERDNHEQQNEV
jgi:hypothetical protein